MKQLLNLINFILLICFTLHAAGHQEITNVRGNTIIIIDNAATTNNKGQNVALTAMSLQGMKYKYGGNSPETGFDCSGFVKYVVYQASNIKLPRTSHGMSNVGQSIEKSQLQAGDLVFFNTLQASYSHVGIYVGNQKFIHAPRSGKRVRVENMNQLYWKKRYNGAKRID